MFITLFSSVAAFGKSLILHHIVTWALETGYDKAEKFSDDHFPDLINYLTKHVPWLVTAQLQTALRADLDAILELTRNEAKKLADVADGTVKAQVAANVVAAVAANQPAAA